MNLMNTLRMGSFPHDRRCVQTRHETTFVPPSTRIHHLMTFMRYYEGKYAYNVWNRLYEQYLGECWMGYYCV